MRPEARLEVRCSDPMVRGNLASVLAPDNEGVPRDLTLEVQERGRDLGIVVTAGTASASVTTVLALLRDVALFQEVWLLSRGEHARSQESQAT